MTIQEATKLSRERLQEIYDEGEATAITVWLLESIVGSPKNERAGSIRQPLDDAQQATLESRLNRLINHEPLQYVLGETWFCGLKFYVDERVLIPRPETEELVEWVIAGCKFPLDELAILDIGTGSGCISVTLKRRLGKSQVTGIDKSHDALDVARKNANSIGVELSLLEVDFLDPEQSDQMPSFDIIISNPPYIPLRDKETMSANVVDFEPGIALFVSDNDPFIFYKAIIRFASEHLKENGSVDVEMHEDLAKETQALFAANGFDTAIRQDMQGKERMLRAWPKV